MDASMHRYRADCGWSEPLPEWDSPRTLVVAFAAPEFRDDPAPLDELAAAYPRSHVIGCSTAGEIFGESVGDDSVAAVVMRFEATEVRTAGVRIDPDDSFQAGKELAAELADPSLRAVLVLSEGLNVNGSELARALDEMVGPDVVVTGGLAADGSRFEHTWVYGGGEVHSHRIIAAGLYGDRVRVGYGSKGGWDAFGPERTITAAAGNTLYELDGQPALSLYKKYLGELADDLPASGLLFPLAIRPAGDADHPVVRTILAVDEATESLTFAGDMPEGYRAQLMRANFDRLVEGAETAAGRAGRDMKGPTVALAISCVGRRLVLGERIDEEVEATQDVLPDGTLQIGFYSYGELSPFGAASCELHNQTMTLTTIGET